MRMVEASSCHGVGSLKETKKSKQKKEDRAGWGKRSERTDGEEEEKKGKDDGGDQGTAAAPPPRTGAERERRTYRE